MTTKHNSCDNVEHVIAFLEQLSKKRFKWFAENQNKENTDIYKNKENTDIYKNKENTDIQTSFKNKENTDIYHSIIKKTLIDVIR